MFNLEKFKFGNKAGYTPEGKVDFNYRQNKTGNPTLGSNTQAGPAFNTDVMSAEGWNDFGSRGGTISDTGSLVGTSRDGLQLGMQPGTSPGFWGADGFSANDAVGLAGLGMDAFNAWQSMQKTDILKDQYDTAKDLAYKNLAMKKGQYNNSLARTAAVNKHFGVDNVHKTV